MNPPAVAVEGLSKRFGRRLAVDGLSFQVPAGSVCGFLGRNGAGKSTAIRMMMNLLDPTAAKSPCSVSTAGATTRRSWGASVTCPNLRCSTTG